jgi:hypothetical protein
MRRARYSASRAPSSLPIMSEQVKVLELGVGLEGRGKQEVYGSAADVKDAIARFRCRKMALPRQARLLDTVSPCFKRLGGLSGSRVSRAGQEESPSV